MVGSRKQQENQVDDSHKTAHATWRSHIRPLVCKVHEIHAISSALENIEEIHLYGGTCVPPEPEYLGVPLTDILFG